MRPGRTRPAGSCHSSLNPKAKVCGQCPRLRSNFAISCLETEPRAPSASTVRPAWISTPAVKLGPGLPSRSEEHTSELQSRLHLVCRLLLETKKEPATDPTVPTPVD